MDTMKSILYSLVALATVTLTLAATPALAQEQIPLTDAHIARITSNCQVTLATLEKLHASDAPIYINRNQTYFSISDKLMARLNSRLALNSFDTTQMVKTVSSYNSALAQFRTAYKQYDDSLTELIKVDCKRQPVSFFYKVADTRQQRQKVYEAGKKLRFYIDQYRTDVRSFQSQHLTQLVGDSHE